MAQLSSPGVSVTVIDESFYTPAAPGTTPLIIVASAENKDNGAGTGVATATTKAKAGVVQLLTSQKDLSDSFGTPKFITDANNNPVHGGELNEYGLQAAYSYLGVSNRAYVVRADLDTSQLEASADAPAGEAANGTYWVDVGSTQYGIFEWNAAPITSSGGQTFKNKIPVVITDSTKILPGGIGPKPSIGAIGDYAIVALTTLLKVWFKSGPVGVRPAQWVEVGSPQWIQSWPTVSGTAVTGVVNLSKFNVSLYDPVTGILDSTVEVEITGTSVDDVVDNINALTELTDYGILAAKVNNKITIYADYYDVALDVEGIDPMDAAVLEDLGLVARTYTAPALVISKHTQPPQWKAGSDTSHPTGSVWIKTTEYNAGAKWSVKRYNSTTAAWETKSAPIYNDGVQALYGLDASGGGSHLALNTLYVKSNDGEESPPIANFKLYRRSATGATSVKSTVITDTTFDQGVDYIFSIQESVAGKAGLNDPIEITFTSTLEEDLSIGQTLAEANAQGLAAAITNALDAENNPFKNIIAESDSQNRVTIRHILGGEFYMLDEMRVVALLFLEDSNFTAAPEALQDDAENPTHFRASLWKPLVGSVNSDSAPTTDAADGQLWYNSIHDEVDLLVHNGETWVGYQYDGNGISAYPSPYYGSTDPNGPINTATEPTTQTDGTTALADGDIWIDPSDTENYPVIYRYNGSFLKWVKLDVTDQTTEDGVLFADARWAVDGGTSTAATESTIAELLSSDFLDFDAPDPALYPQGMILWNLRRSGFNVKKFVRNYVDIYAENHRQDDLPMETYYPHRWVSQAANQEDGSGTFGRKAQRKVVVQALQALVNSNQQIRDEESRVFNLIACPGYPELIGELVNLNYDRGLTAFVVGDTPARLPADATSLSNWGSNQALALEDNDNGLVTFDEYLGVFYPWGYTSDNLGNNVVVPPSHMMLRTIALSDNVSYPWFAPAGTRRGGITNASAVGYVDATTGEFQSVALNTGQRDTLQTAAKVNPLTFITGTGLVNYGQLTRAKNASSLDRINVARLVVYLRRQLNSLAKPYIFEPNDKITRDEIKQAAESLMLELVGQRAIYDFLVVCDTSNNTPSRIDRNELYLDIAIEPVKAVEFIYIPLRLKNTGEIKGLGGK